MFSNIKPRARSKGPTTSTRGSITTTSVPGGRDGARFARWRSAKEIAPTALRNTAGALARIVVRILWRVDRDGEDREDAARTEGRGRRNRHVFDHPSVDVRVARHRTRWEDHGDARRGDHRVDEIHRAAGRPWDTAHRVP